MTLRLVSLISVVLLLCLGAFGLLMGRYQDQVMEEVARTASAVGQATLRTLELRGTVSGDEPSAPSVRESSFVWQWPGDGKESKSHEPAGTPSHRFEKVVVTRTVHLPQEAADLDRQKPGGAGTAAAAGEPSAARLEACFRAGLGTHATAFLIDVDEVRAESDPARGLVLRIPNRTPAPAGGPLADTPGGTEPDPGNPGAIASEIRLPIPVGEYQALFQRFRGRSLALFCGVFLVGVALSTGLAARFTRPIRRLDDGIRLLAEGDLDVEVAVAGKDEIARLSRAFNEMARKLRSNRDRARELVRREKLSALGRLAAGVAHDVRNPLHSIGLTLQHLQETSRPEDSRAADFDHALGIMRGEIRRLDQLVENFLRFAGSQRRQHEAVDLAELLQETARLVRKEAEWRGVRLALELGETVPRVEVDGDAIRSCILNLVLNAFEAMPDGGKLTLALRGAGDEVLVEVADTGRGIPEEEQERVFEFAYTTREDGNGLGLAMVHHLVVEEHGGRVHLESSPGAGTRVVLALPARPVAQLAAS